MKTRRYLVALLVWAIDRDMLDKPVTECMQLFSKDAKLMMSTYTDPTDVLLFVPRLVNNDPIRFFVDYVLFHARLEIVSSIISYGRLDKSVIDVTTISKEKALSIADEYHLRYEVEEAMRNGDTPEEALREWDIL